MKAIISLLLMTSCYPNTKPVTNDPVTEFPDSAKLPADGGSPEEYACFALASMGCTEGLHPKCVQSMLAAEASHVSSLDVTCILRSTSKDDARGCGVRCMP